MTELQHQQLATTRVFSSDRLKYHMIFLWEPDMVKSSDEFENGCILMHCGGG